VAKTKELKPRYGAGRRRRIITSVLERAVSRERLTLAPTWAPLHRAVCPSSIIASVGGVIDRHTPLHLRLMGGATWWSRCH